MVAVVDHPIELRGAPWELLEWLRAMKPPARVVEAMVEGGGGTGKSRGIGHVLWTLGYEYPGLQMLVVRKTRESLSEAFLKTWENECVPPNDRMLMGPDRKHRQGYDFGNGSMLIAGGLDKASKHYSTNWDVVYEQEATEIEEDQHQQWLRGLRNFGKSRVSPNGIKNLGFQLLLLDLNPDAPGFWANRRFPPATVTDQNRRRFLSRHYDNPAWYDLEKGEWTPEGRAYLGSLANLSPVRKRRLLKGEWCAAEGVVWDSFDRSVNVLPAVPENRERWYYIATVDWGKTAAGCIEVFGVDPDRNLYRVAEIYRTQKSIEWWAERMVELAREFAPMEAIPCDPARPDAIEKFNEYLNRANLPSLARGADNARTSSGKGDLAGLDLVHTGFHDRRIFIVENVLREGRDEALYQAHKPCGLLDEIPEYVYEIVEAGHPNREHTEKSCEDHACDCLRYAANHVWRYNYTPAVVEIEKCPVGSYGDVLGHKKWLEEQKEQDSRLQAQFARAQRRRVRS